MTIYKVNEYSFSFQLVGGLESLPGSVRSTTQYKLVCGDSKVLVTIHVDSLKYDVFEEVEVVCVTPDGRAYAKRSSAAPREIQSAITEATHKFYDWFVPDFELESAPDDCPLNPMIPVTFTYEEIFRERKSLVTKLESNSDDYDDLPF